MHDCSADSAVVDPSLMHRCRQSSKPTSGACMEKSCARRTSALYTAVSPCGWYLPSTSPTTRAHLQTRPMVSAANYAAPQCRLPALRSVHFQILTALIIKVLHSCLAIYPSLAVRLPRSHAKLVHGKEDAPVHRLEAIAHIRQRAAHDHRHGILQRMGQLVRQCCTHTHTT